MYIIDREKNNIQKIKKNTFSELHFKEREHLQEWIAKNPSSLGEELLIIQKEFSGFSETKERLDLLALDLNGNLVIIENKLDDSGKDVVWQSIKYASYCSSLTHDEVIKIYQRYLGEGGNAESKISEFLGKEVDEIILNEGGNSQRIILIAANFRKEVTSAMLWLMNFNIKIKCFKVSPYSLDEKLLLDINQVLPVKDIEDFSISMASKIYEESRTKETLQNRHIIRLAFWEQFLKESNKRNNIYLNHSPSKDSWIGKGIGESGITLNLVVSRNYCRSEIYINKGSKTLNKIFFDKLFLQKKYIEQEVGFFLDWEKMEEKVTSRIKYENKNLNFFEKESWAGINDFLIESSEKMEEVFKKIIKEL